MSGAGAGFQSAARTAVARPARTRIPSGNRMGRSWRNRCDFTHHERRYAPGYMLTRRSPPIVERRMATLPRFQTPFEGVSEFGDAHSIVLSPGGAAVDSPG